MTKKFKKEFLPFILGNAVTLILQIALNKFLINTLTLEHYSYVAYLAMTTFVLVSLYSGPDSQALYRLYSEFKARTKKNAFNALYFKCIRRYSFIIAILILLTLVTFIFNQDLILPFFLFTVSFLQSFQALTMSPIKASRKRTLVAILDSGHISLKILSVTALYFFQKTLTPLMVFGAFSISLAISIGLQFFSYLKYVIFGNASANFNLKDVTLFKEYRRPYYDFGLFGLIVFLIDKLVIQINLGAEQLAIYFALWQIVNLITLATTALSQFVAPIIFDRISGDFPNEKAFRQQMLGSMLYLVFLLVLFIPISKHSETITAFFTNDSISKEKVCFLLLYLNMVFFNTAQLMILIGQALNFHKKYRLSMSLRPIVMAILLFIPELSIDTVAFIVMLSSVSFMISVGYRNLVEYRRM